MSQLEMENDEDPPAVHFASVTQGSRDRNADEGRRLSALPQSEAAGQLASRLEDLFYHLEIRKSLSVVELAQLVECQGLLEGIRDKRIQTGVPAIREAIQNVFTSHDFSPDETGFPRSARLSDELLKILRFSSQCGLTQKGEFRIRSRALEKNL